MATGPDNIVIYVGPYWDNSHLMIMRPANLGLTIAVSPTPNQVVLRWTPLATATAYTIELQTRLTENLDVCSLLMRIRLPLQLILRQWINSSSGSTDIASAGSTNS